MFPEVLLFHLCDGIFDVQIVDVSMGRLFFADESWDKSLHVLRVFFDFLFLICGYILHVICCIS